MQEYDILIGQADDGQLLRFGGTEHVALHARTGSGKTSGFAIPNAFSWPGSMVCLDIKGEMFQATAGYRSSVLEQAVFLLDPSSIDGRSHRWDPLAVVERQSINRFDQISRQAFLLFPEAPAGSSGTITLINSGTRLVGLRSLPSRRCWRRRPPSRWT